MVSEKCGKVIGGEDMKYIEGGGDEPALMGGTAWLYLLTAHSKCGFRKQKQRVEHTQYLSKHQENHDG